MDSPISLSTAYAFGRTIADIDLADVPVRDASLMSQHIPMAAFSPPARIRVSRYGEPRLTGDVGTLARRQLGIDIFGSAGTMVQAAIGGRVHAVDGIKGPGDGGWLVIEHGDVGTMFWSCYSHLNPVDLETLQPGTKIAAGDTIGRIGQPESLAPGARVRVQLSLAEPSSAPLEECDADDFAVASATAPNPAPLLCLPVADVTWTAVDKAALLARRARRSIPNLRLSYREPLHFVRGSRHFLYDDEGRRYLDVYNNVPHVGHAHPTVVSAVQRQVALLATNSRYLQEQMLDYADALTSRLPESLSVCFFVNSGSEANDLALRIARKATRRQGIAVMEHCYHGITTADIEISPYKFDHPLGIGKPDFVEIMPQPDLYRAGGTAIDDDLVARFIAQGRSAIDKIAASEHGLAAVICECAPSVGGQIMLPPGYLPAIYRHVRDHGGVCIADDVQTALGRLGTGFWGFEYAGVAPDILVLGKPLGNGHPLAAVITTPAIAELFADGPEYFSTFGGSTVSCVAGTAVLRVLAEESLQSQAERVGGGLLAGFRGLAMKHAAIGDVRGTGFFLGIELVEDRDTRAPATRQAGYIKQRLVENRILIGTEGPFDNVLKIRPPMTFDQDAADMLLDALDRVLDEPGAQS